MISKKINLSTGPVGITENVRQALAELPVSHRSDAFRELYCNTTDLLCKAFNVKETFLLTGSGTMANEAMMQEIKCIKGKGLILSNGEFGSRLIDQGSRIGLQFTTCEFEWGSAFDMSVVQQRIVQDSIKWVLFCHCETSTGIINDIDAIITIARLHHCRCFADCMSTVGTKPLDLSGLDMATASSGKGLASVPGLGVVFSNMELSLKQHAPVYLDLHHYAKCGGIPFTISSNLLKSLFVSLQQKLRPEQFQLADEYAGRFYQLFNDLGMVPFSSADSRVFTIVAERHMLDSFIQHLQTSQIALSYESDYLKKRGWCQLALFGYYEEKELRESWTAMNKHLNRKFHQFH